MLNIDEFRQEGHRLVDEIYNYYKNIEQYPVKSQVSPGEIFERLPREAPQEPEKFSSIMQDFQEIIMPGITHWQHPNFHAYFPANASFESILAEMLTSAIAAQCMVWATSPAAAELEEMMMNWLRDACGLPSKWHGVIQDTASTATLVSLLTAREKRADYSINKKGFSGEERFIVYCSTQTHSSIDKAVRIAGIGDDNLVKIGVDDNFAMKPDLLEARINRDIEAGFTPLAVVACIGTTSCTAIDPISEIGQICEKFSVWLHIDAAFAGSALILDEFSDLRRGLEKADSYVFNPHKWLFTNFDCSAYYVRDKKALVRTFSIMPEYLKTGVDSDVNNYRDWGIQLGRRFRALKLWFVMRSFGLEGLRDKLRLHIRLCDEFRERLYQGDNFEILFTGRFNLVCFRYNPEQISDENKLERINSELLSKINESGEVFLTHTKLDGKYALRFLVAQTYAESRHLHKAWEIINRYASDIIR